VDLWWGIILVIGAFSFFLLDDVKGRIMIFIIVFLIVGVVGANDYINSRQIPKVMDDMHNYINDGDLIAIDTNHTDLSFAVIALYLSDKDIEFIEFKQNDTAPDYIISQGNQTYDNYTLIRTYEDTSPISFRGWIFSKLKQTLIDSSFEWSRGEPIRVWERL
jgi:hypothetical protein